MHTHAILLHGMGRTPLSMLNLAICLRRAGIKPHLFGYSATFERFESCQIRLQAFIESKVGDSSFVLIGHSLGSVLLRAVLPKLSHQPLACFLLAPPTTACRAARFFRTNFIYRIVMGNMGQLLGDEDFMANLPVPNVPTVIYAGVAGPCGRWSPFRYEPNDGILAVSETRLSAGRVEHVNSLHSFIMNSHYVLADILSAIGDVRKSCLTAMKGDEQWT